MPQRDPGLAKDSDVWSFVRTLLKKSISQYGEKPLFIDATTDERLSYSKFLHNVNNLITILRDCYGVRRGSVIVICSNDLFYYVAVFAAMALGGIVYQVLLDFAEGGIERCLTEEEHVPVVFCDKNTFPKIERYLENNSERFPARPKLLVFDEHPAGSHPTVREILENSENAVVDIPSLNPKDVCAVFMSSGTTGPPKSVEHTHYSLLSSTYNTHVFCSEEQKYGDRLYRGLYSGIGSFFLVLSTIIEHGTHITFSSFRQEMYLKAVEKYKPSFLPLFPVDFMIYANMDEDEWKKYDLSSVRMISSGASVFPRATREKVEKMFPNLALPTVQFYGASEFIFAANSRILGKASNNENGVGYLCPSVKCKASKMMFIDIIEHLTDSDIMPRLSLQVISVTDGQLLGPNERGEIFIHTPFLAQGYRNRPDLYAQVVTDDGWYKSGDYGYYNDNRCLLVLDRIKDLIHLNNGEIGQAKQRWDEMTDSDDLKANGVDIGRHSPSDSDLPSTSPSLNAEETNSRQNCILRSVLSSPAVRRGTRADGKGFEQSIAKKRKLEAILHSNPKFARVYGDTPGPSSLSPESSVPSPCKKEPKDDFVAEEGMDDDDDEDDDDMNGAYTNGGGSPCSNDGMGQEIVVNPDVDLNTVFALVPGRLSLLSNSPKYKVTVGEVKRRLEHPECLNVSLLGSMLRRAKARNAGKDLRNKLSQVGMEVPNGWRRASNPTLLTALVEGEAVVLARDFGIVCESDFPGGPLAQYHFEELMKTKPSHEELVKQVDLLVGAIRVVAQLLDTLNKDCSKLVNSSPPIILPQFLQVPLENYNRLTHGFGVSAIQSSLMSTQKYMTSYLNKVKQKLAGTEPVPDTGNGKRSID
ncbi:unnamed protein product [Notodromas monacha]|uniref:Uncharacterized protein n=1 Tax=Notodromas monacha TaxID=399045 RepID=A0A7R9BUC0_9CRUS|nr:unnamed protein product [Notodromas monacha]CAG0920514.1 unnamed protein product [Notodromas monacha]